MCAFVGLMCSKKVGLLLCLLSLTSCFFWENGVGGVCSMYGGEERCIQGLGGET